MARKRSLSSALTFFIRVKSWCTTAGVEVLPWTMTACAADLDSPQSASAFFTQSFWAGLRRGPFVDVEGWADAGLSSGFALASFTAGGGVGAGGSGSQAPIAFPPSKIAPREGGNQTGAK